MDSSNWFDELDGTAGLGDLNLHSPIPDDPLIGLDLIGGGRSPLEEDDDSVFWGRSPRVLEDSAAAASANSTLDDDDDMVNAMMNRNNNSSSNQGSIYLTAPASLAAPHDETKTRPRSRTAAKARSRASSAAEMSTTTGSLINVSGTSLAGSPSAQNLSVTSVSSAASSNHSNNHSNTSNSNTLQLPPLGPHHRRSNSDGTARKGHNRRVSDPQFLTEVASRLPGAGLITTVAGCGVDRPHYCAMAPGLQAGKFAEALLKGSAVAGRCWLSSDTVFAGQQDALTPLFELARQFVGWAKTPEAAGEVEGLDVWALPWRVIRSLCESSELGWAMRTYLECRPPVAAAGAGAPAPLPPGQLARLASHCAACGNFDAACALAAAAIASRALQPQELSAIVRDVLAAGLRSPADVSERMRQVVDQASAAGCPPSIKTANMLMEAFTMFGRHGEVLNLVQALPNLGLAMDRDSYAVVIRCLFADGKQALAARLYSKAVGLGIYKCHTGPLSIHFDESFTLEEVRLALMHHRDNMDQQKVRGELVVTVTPRERREVVASVMKNDMGWKTTRIGEHNTIHVPEE